MNAIRTGDFSGFFDAQDARTAVPLSFTARHITGNREVVALRSTQSYTVSDCFRCVDSLQMDEFSLQTPRYNTGGSDASFTGCKKSLNVTYTADCGGGASRVRFGALENRLGNCNANWLTSNPNDCSLHIFGEDKRGAFGGVCEVACRYVVVAQRPKPNQPPVCQYAPRGR